MFVNYVHDKLASGLRGKLSKQETQSMKSEYLKSRYVDTIFAHSIS